MSVCLIYDENAWLYIHFYYQINLDQTLNLLNIPICVCTPLQLKLKIQKGCILEFRKCHRVLELNSSVSPPPLHTRTLDFTTCKWEFDELTVKTKCLCLSAVSKLQHYDSLKMVKTEEGLRYNEGERMLSVLSN